jgi:hypothetical protein
VTSPVGARRAAERWFLDHGLPSVLTPRARLRSAPALAGFATLGLCSLLIYLLTGRTHIDIDGEPTTAEWIVLGIVVLALTATGVGSVLGWALRLTRSQIAAVGTLLIRALPVVLLTVLVFFNTYVWVMAATISRRRLWLALLLLVVMAAVFVISGTLKRARPMLTSATASAQHADRLAGTPFSAMPDPEAADPLTRGERLNVAFVLIASQIAQILMVAVVTAAIFFVLGLMLPSPPLLAAWTRNGSSDGTVLGMTIPVPQALIQMTLFPAALTFM